MIPLPYDMECERVVADLLGLMTPAEKVGQLAVRSVPSLSDREGMDILLSDLRNGRVGCLRAIADAEQATELQKIARDDTRLGIPLLLLGSVDNGLETVLPSPLASAASWSPDLLEMASAIIGQEASEHGINLAFGTEARLSDQDDSSISPGSWGEDPMLATLMLAARIRGLQRSNHRQGGSLIASLDLSPLAAAVEAGKHEDARLIDLAALLISSARIGAIDLRAPHGQDYHAITNLLRPLSTPGGFDGIFLNAWQAMVAAAGEEERDVVRDGVPHHALLEALDDGRLAPHILDEAVARVLRAKFRHGLLRAALAANTNDGSRTLPTPVHNRETALKLAKACPVLLRNDPAILPLGIDSGDVLLVGPAAADRHRPLAGAPGIAASVLDGFEQLGIPHRFVSGLAMREGGKRAQEFIAADSMAIGMAIEAAKRAGTVIAVMTSDDHGHLSEAEGELLAALANATDNLALVNLGSAPMDPYYSGRPLAGSLHVGQLGTMSGHAIAELLSGESSPCGKLPVAIAPRGKSPGLPFGYGLSYADFGLGKLIIEKQQDRVRVSFDLRNLSDDDGVDTVQLYLRHFFEADESEDRTVSDYWLASFQRHALAAGERKTICFDLDRDQLGCHASDGSFSISEGRFEVFVGLNSTQGKTGEFNIDATFARSLSFAGLHARTA